MDCKWILVVMGDKAANSNPKISKVLSNKKGVVNPATTVMNGLQLEFSSDGSKVFIFKLTIRRYSLTKSMNTVRERRMLFNWSTIVKGLKASILNPTNIYVLANDIYDKIQIYYNLI